VSRETISKITDEIVADMAVWQNRPLEAVYAVLLIDAITVKVRDTQVSNRPVYVAIGVDLTGERDVLGLWLGPAGGEGAKQWATMLTELRNRGLADALIVCCDSLRGLPEAIRLTWPQATVQTCVVHLENSIRYASRKHWGQITRAMRAIYTAPTARVFTDEWRSYLPLRSMGFDHHSVAHGAREYVRGEVHVNGMENYWSLLKRCYIGTYHYWSPEHLERYVTEHSFRYNRRKMHVTDRMAEAAALMEGRSLSWRELTDCSESRYGATQVAVGSTPVDT